MPLGNGPSAGRLRKKARGVNRGLSLNLKFEI
jgi:hypothetical protein